MTESHGRLPHALATAHRGLIKALDRGIEQFKENLRYSNSHDVCRCIERFVDALYQNSGGPDELRRRATLVETRCGPGSDYETARAQSLPSYQGQPRKLTGSKEAIGRLRKSEERPLFLAQVVQERQDIEQVLNEGTLNLSAAARQAYESWRSACRAVQREGELLEVDGCWYLLHIHEAGEDTTSERAECAKAITQSDVGGANLAPIKAAVDSLVGWVTENTPSPDNRDPTRKLKAGGKRRGRKKADYKTVQREAQLAAKWKRARESGTYKIDFAKDNGMTVRNLDRLLDRVYSRKQHSD